MVSLGWGSSGRGLADKAWSDGASKAVSEVNVFNLRQRSIAVLQTGSWVGFLGAIEDWFHWILLYMNSSAVERRLKDCSRACKRGSGWLLTQYVPYRSYRSTMFWLLVLLDWIFPVPKRQTQMSGPCVVHTVSRIYTTCIRSVHQRSERPSKVSGCRQTMLNTGWIQFFVGCSPSTTVSCCMLLSTLVSMPKNLKAQPWPRTM